MTSVKQVWETRRRVSATAVDPEVAPRADERFLILRNDSAQVPVADA